MAKISRKASRFCVVFVPRPEKRTGECKPPFFVFRGPPSSDGLMNKCNRALQTKINLSKGQIVFGNENEINLVERRFGERVHCVDWNGSSTSGSLVDFIKGHAVNYLSNQAV